VAGLRFIIRPILSGIGRQSPYQNREPWDGCEKGDKIEEHDLKEFVDGFDVLGAILGAEDEPLSWKGYLPEDATGIEEFSWSDGFLPDYSYMLRARIPEPEFNAFVEKLGLTPHGEDRDYSEQSIWLSWEAAPQFEGDWWNPTSGLGGTYVREGDDTWSYAKYEDGTLYFKSLNH